MKPNWPRPWRCFPYIALPENCRQVALPGAYPTWNSNPSMKNCPFHWRWASKAHTCRDKIGDLQSWLHPKRPLPGTISTKFQLMTYWKYYDFPGLRLKQLLHGFTGEAKSNSHVLSHLCIENSTLVELHRWAFASKRLCNLTDSELRSIKAKLLPSLPEPSVTWRNSVVICLTNMTLYE